MPACRPCPPAFPSYSIHELPLGGARLQLVGGAHQGRGQKRFPVPSPRIEPGGALRKAAGGRAGGRERGRRGAGRRGLEGPENGGVEKGNSLPSPGIEPGGSLPGAGRAGGRAGGKAAANGRAHQGLGTKMISSSIAWICSLSSTTPLGWAARCLQTARSWYACTHAHFMDAAVHHGQLFRRLLVPVDLAGCRIAGPPAQARAPATSRPKLSLSPASRQCCLAARPPPPYHPGSL